MHGIPAKRHPHTRSVDRIGIGEIGRTIIAAISGAAGGLAFGAIYGSMVIMLFGALGGAVAGMITNELRREA
jgi:hypothetical protein